MLSLLSLGPTRGIIIVNVLFAVPKKKKKKHSHHRGDQVKLANLKRFTSMVVSLFDQQMAEGMPVVRRVQYMGGSILRTCTSLRTQLYST